MSETRTQIVFPAPCPTRGLLALGEAPGAEEDIAGDGFVGRAGKTLDRLLAAHGFGRNQFGRANICRCRPVNQNGENRKPTATEIHACIPWLKAEIERTEPSVILCVGWTPGQMFFEGKSLFDALQPPIGGVREFLPNSMDTVWLLKDIKKPVTVVLMPHTSPLAFNRNAPDGKKWSQYCDTQVQVCSNLLNRNL